MNFTRRIASIIAVCVLLACGAIAQSSPNSNANSSSGSAISFVAGRFVANEYASSSGLFANAAIYQGNAATGSSTITVRGGYIVLKDGRAVMPWAINVPILINDANPELVTLTANPSGCYNSKGMNQDAVLVTCTLTGSFTFLHGLGATVMSATGGVAEANQDAYNQGGGTVVIPPGFSLNTSCTGCYTSLANAMANLPVEPNVQFEDTRSNNIRYWTPQPSTLSALATPTTRVGSTANCTGTHTVCDTSIAVASGGFTNAAQYVWVAYVDILGGIGPASATANYTSAGAVQIEFIAPAASTGAVGWIFGIGTSYAAAYWIPVTSANCTLTTIETVVPACAITNTNFNQTGSNAFVSKPLTTFALYPAAAGVAAAYNPVFQSHTTFAYQPSGVPSLGFQTSFGPFPATGALTAGQASVLGTVALPIQFLNTITRKLRMTGKLTLTPSTSGSVQILVGIGDITDFTTGTPKAVCTLTTTGTITTAAYDGQFQCDWTTNATGTTGTIMPDGFSIFQLQAGTTTSPSVAVESATGAITADVLDEDLLYVAFLQTSAAESTTPPQLQSFSIEPIN
jgi:hypothetical protein